MQTLADRVRWLRETSDLTQRGLAGLINSGSPAHINRIEKRPGGGISTNTARELCRVFGVTLGWLLFGTKPKPTERDIKEASRRAVEAKGKEGKNTSKTKGRSRAA